MTQFHILRLGTNGNQFLTENHYSFALFDGLNRFYYRSEEPFFRELLQVPANVRDGFTLHKTSPMLAECNSGRSFENGPLVGDA